MFQLSIFIAGFLLNDNLEVREGILIFQDMGIGDCSAIVGLWAKN